MTVTAIAPRPSSTTMSHSGTAPPTSMSSRGWGPTTWTPILLTRRLCSLRELLSFNPPRSTGSSWWPAATERSVSVGMKDCRSQCSCYLSSFCVYVGIDLGLFLRQLCPHIASYCEPGFSSISMPLTLLSSFRLLQ